MKKMFFMMGAVILVVILAHARPVKFWQPDELYKKADAVVIAVVKEVRKTGRTAEIQLGKTNPKYKTLEFAAKLHVQHVIKGTVSEQCELKYETLDPESIDIIVNGPGRIHMEKGKVYLVYLKNTPKKASYLGVLAGDFDDGQAVKEIK
jgi:hypothetical protein